jgi:hypothetical protein
MLRRNKCLKLRGESFARCRRNEVADHSHAVSNEANHLVLSIEHQRCRGACQLS